MMTDDVKMRVEALREGACCCACNEAYPTIDRPYPCEQRVRTNDNMDKAADLIETLSAELEKVKRERDAAVEELSFSRKCSICKKHLSEGGDCYGNHKCGNGNPAWQWRGVKEDAE